MGFRRFIERSARELDLHGRVRNLPDGTVEIEVQGPERLVGELERRACSGPSRSRVTGVRKKELDPDSSLNGFKVLF